MKKLLPLLFILGVALGVGVVSAQTTYEVGTVFISEVGGGNITFAGNTTATLFSNAVGNQARFTTLHMLANGTWSRLGFGNDNSNNTMNITRLGTDYISFDAIIPNNTILEVYLPDHGEPDTVTGGIADNWITPTLFITMTGDDTITLEWTGETPEPISTGLSTSIDLIIQWIPLIALLFLFKAKEEGILNSSLLVFVIAIVVLAFMVGVFRSIGF